MRAVPQDASGGPGSESCFIDTYRHSVFAEPPALRTVKTSARCCAALSTLIDLLCSPSRLRSALGNGGWKRRWCLWSGKDLLERRASGRAGGGALIPGIRLWMCSNPVRVRLRSPWRPPWRGHCGGRALGSLDTSAPTPQPTAYSATAPMFFYGPAVHRGQGPHTTCGLALSRMPPWIAMFCKIAILPNKSRFLANVFAKIAIFHEKSREASRRRPPTPTHTGS